MPTIFADLWPFLILAAIAFAVAYPFIAMRRGDARMRKLLAENEDGDPRVRCPLPPAGWWCSRGAGHDGPCAARLIPASGVPTNLSVGRICPDCGRTSGLYQAAEDDERTWRCPMDGPFTIPPVRQMPTVKG